MKKICLTPVLFLLVLLGMAQQPTEQDVDNQLQQARDAVNAAQSAVTAAQQAAQQKAQAVAQLRTDWNNKEAAIKSLQDQILAADNTLAKSTEHIDQEIKRCQDVLATLKKNNADAEAIDQAQRAVTANQNLKKSLLKRSDVAAAKAGFQKSLQQTSAALDALRDQLQAAIADAKTADDQLTAAQQQLTNAQGVLEDLLQKAPALLAYIAPPYVKKVTVHGEGGGTYAAEWVDYSKAIDEKIAVIKKGIQEQQSILDGYKKLIEQNCNDLMEQQAIADQALDNYVYEVQHNSWVKLSIADMLDATVSIARNFKEMGPYAFAYEAIYRLAELKVTGGPSDFDIMKLPGQKGAPVDVSSIAGNVLMANIKDQVKGLIQQALQSYIGTSDFGIPGAGLHYGTEASIGGAKAGLIDLVRNGKFWVVADKDLCAKWMARLTDPHFKGTLLEDMYATLKRDPKAFLQNWKSSFNMDKLKGALLDVAQSTAIQLFKEWLDRKRLNLWSDYLVEDQKRSDLLTSLKVFGAERQMEQIIMQSLNEVLQDLIREKEDQAYKPTRFLKINANDVVSGTSCTITLEFSAGTQVDSVTLQGKTITGSISNNTWTGTANIANMKEDLAQLTVAAKGKLSQKIIDDPVTDAEFAGTTQSWKGYEPKNDVYHKVKLHPLRKGTSIVLLVDCSGSMGDNHKMERAIKAAESVLSSKDFEPNDEIALMAFYDCGGAQVIQSFTSDFDLLKKSLQALHPSQGTPLALSMKQASQYLESAAHNPYRKLIVLTDGEESCGGDEFDALMTIKLFHQQLETRTQ